MIFTPNLIIALIATVISFSTLYIPQPMLPLLAESFGVSAGEAGLLMTVAMLPLAIAPSVYGYFLQAIPAKLMLTVYPRETDVNGCARTTGTRPGMFLFCRRILAPDRVAAAAGFAAAGHFYCLDDLLREHGSSAVGASRDGILYWRDDPGWLQRPPDGGCIREFLRLAQRFCRDGPDAADTVATVNVKSDADINFARLDPKSISRVLLDRNFRFMFLSLASVFFVFSGILNIVPFHLQNIDATATPFIISLLYLGYLVGAPVSFFSDSISKLLNDERKGLWLGLLIHGFGLVMLLFVAFKGLVLMMFFLAAGFFLIHALLSGLTNHLAQEHKGVVNGLYVSIYYFSGALGSWLPGYLFEGLGWNGMIIVFMLILGFCAWSISQLRLPSG
jgi:YNFM family putative membrane transporter